MQDAPWVDGHVLVKLEIRLGKRLQLTQERSCKPNTLGRALPLGCRINRPSQQVSDVTRYSIGRLCISQVAK